MKTFPRFLSLVLSALLALTPVSAQTASDLQIQVVDRDSEAAPGSVTGKGFTIQVTDLSGTPVADAAVVVRLPETGPGGTFSDGTHSAIAYTGATGRASITGIHWGPETGAGSIRITATRGSAHAGMLIEQQIGDKNIAPPALSVAAPADPVKTPQPGTPAPKNVPPPQAVAEPAAPKVSVVNAPTHEKIHSGSSKKWIILLAVIGAGAGAGVALAAKGKSSSSSSTSTGTTIGTPTISVGNP